MSGPDAGKFEISTDGALTFEAQPNFEAPGDSNRDNVYEVTVVASDPAKNSDELDVRVTVTNVAEDGTITFSSLQPKVGAALTATFADADGSITDLKWQWSSDDTDRAEADRTEAFEDETSDTYTPVAADVGDILTVTATYRDGALAADADDITLPVAHTANVAADTDNKAPRFLDDDDEVVTTVERTIAEDTEPGSVSRGIGAPVGASDPMPAGTQLPEDVLTYTLGGVDEASFDIDDADGQLRTKAALDYEDKQSYTVTVTATDPGGLSATVTVTIEVTDVNEVPKLDGEAPEEYAENGTAPVATFTAVDPERKAIEWSVTGTDAEDFTIVGGVLRFKESPNFEAAGRDNTYEVTVNASDGTNDDTDDTKEVTIEVTNVDEPGTVTLSILQPQVGVELTATLSDSDVVSGTPTWMWFRGSSAIANATNAAYTPVTGDVGSKLKAKATYKDAEDAEDDKNAEGSSARSVRSVPTSGNILPVFPTQVDETTAQTRKVAENTPSGRNIGTPVVASDTGDVLTYSIDDTDDATFDIDRATGQLKTQAPLNADGSATTSYEVTVTAKDPFGSMAMAEVTIEVTDVDEDPSITTTTEADTAIPFMEDAAITTALATYAAADPEGLAISWDVSGPDAGKFEISTDGALTFEAQPNFEAPGDSNRDNVYEVTVVASDPAKNSDELDVRVTVTDVVELGMITFSSLQPKVGAALTATLTDADGSITDLKWQWSSNGGRSEEAFEDATSDTYTPVAADVGAMLTATATYRDGFLAADADDITLPVAHTANVAADTDNKAPRFLDDDDEVVTSVERMVEENTPAGMDIGGDDPVMASDPEVASGLTELLTYTLGGVDAASFDINVADGQLRTKAALDYEDKQSYTVTVTATDPGGLSATVTVTIEVTDDNEAPTIMVGGLAISGMARVDYPDNGTGAVETYTASGPDAASATWSLDGDDAGDFRISSRGVLTFRSSPDYENPADANTDNTYMVTVKATDGTYTPTRDVTVRVTTDVVDTTPTGGTLVERFDSNDNEMIDKDDVTQVIRDYLFGDGVDPSKADVVAVIRHYLFS